MNNKKRESFFDELGIESWDEFTQEKFLEYISMLPDISEETRLKVIEQMPNTLDFTRDLLKTMIVQQENILNSNNKSIEATINSLNSIQKTLDKLSDQPNLTKEDIKYIADKQMELAYMYKSLD